MLDWFKHKHSRESDLLSRNWKISFKFYFFRPWYLTLLSATADANVWFTYLLIYMENDEIDCRESTLSIAFA